MAFRYRILFYHENQPWVSKIAPLLDLPLFHLVSTDTDTVVQKQLESGEVDIILTGTETEHFMLVEDKDNSLTYKRTVVWEVIDEGRVPCKVILLCTQKELAIASDLVQQGKVADYFIVSPMLDKTRLFVSIMKTLESSLQRQVIEKKLLRTEQLPIPLLESIEKLLEVRDMEEPEPEPPPAEPEPPTADQWPEETPDEDEEAGSPADDDPWGGTAFPAFPSANESAAEEDDEEEGATALPEDSVFASLTSSSSESSFSVESLFPSLADEPKTQTSPWPEIPELDNPPPKQNGPKVAVSGMVTHNWTRMQKSEFEILLIDSDHENIGVVQDTVGAVGYKVLVANTAEEAMFYLNREEFELLLVNRDLPDEDGLDLLNKIRYKGPQSHLPAIVLSASANEEHVIKSIKVGANYFIVKPINPDKLLRHVFELAPR